MTTKQLLLLLGAGLTLSLLAVVLLARGGASRPATITVNEVTLTVETIESKAAPDAGVRIVTTFIERPGQRYEFSQKTDPRLKSGDLARFNEGRTAEGILTIYGPAIRHAQKR